MNNTLVSSRHWGEVISADINRLYEINQDFSFAEELRLYSRVILSYLQNNLPQLYQLHQHLTLVLEENSSHQKENYFLFVLKTLTETRLYLRTQQISLELIEELKSIAHKEEIYAGEVHFLLAMAQDSLNQLREAKESYLKAAFYLEKEGALRKSVKSSFNAIVCESRQQLHHNFTPDYEQIAKKAILVEEHYVAGVALNNISQEYQLVGAPRVALNYNQEALKYLEKTGQRTVNYYLALLHRCHLLIDIGRKEEAQLDYEKCLVAPFDAVQEALKVLAPFFGEVTPNTINKNALSLNWKMRLESRNIFKDSKQKKEENFTDAEEKVIQLLLQEPRTRLELAESLYGNQLDPWVLENRIKVFFSKIRKKKPGLIVYSQGKYSISPELYPELLKK